MSVKRHIPLLFDRPYESLINYKGENDSLFQLTPQLMPKDYAANGVELNSRFGADAGEVIPLMNLDKVPEFPKASQLPMDADFSLFLPSHQEMSEEVITALMDVPENELQQLLSTCVYARNNLNPQLFNYCLSVALMHRNDTKDVEIPNFVETFPSKFLDAQVFRDAREVAAVVPRGVARTPIIIPRDFTGSNLDVEHRVAYWREDIGINLHHWHWHVVYPATGVPRALVDKDRRGELFCYMHEQILARYNCERLDSLLFRVERLNNFREPIKEGYFSKLDTLTSERAFPPRQAGMKWQNLNRPVDNYHVTIETLEGYRKNIEEAIATGKIILPDGSTTDLNIDDLGNLVQPSLLSKNMGLYGSLHNNGHAFIAYIHDPEHRFLESFGVMLSEPTAMRDPLFYRWHAFIDDIFQKHKESQYVRPYTRSQLDNPGVEVASATIETPGGQPNTLNTFWMSSDMDLSRGLDFSNRGPVYVRFTHLNHRPFNYVIKVNNTGNARRATVRIFISPKFDERKQPWILNDQRKMFVEMDRFVTPLNAGQNTIIRQSRDSSVTIPFEQTFRDLSPMARDPHKEGDTAFNFCGCGWPQHMLVPRGTELGARYEMFVMLSNYDLDAVPTENGQEMSCKEASSYCGLRDRKYPDRRSMGYPFDRPSDSAFNIQDFLLPNMVLQDITIRHEDVTVPNPRNPQN